MTEPGKVHTHILIVEDDQDLRESLTEALEDQGYSVASEPNGQRALSYLHSAPRPDLILLDLQMPIMNGVEFREEQLRDAGLATIPVAVLSADPSGRSKIAPLQTAGFLPKPLDMSALFRLIEQIVGPAPLPSPG